MQPSVNVVSTDLDVLIRFRDVVGFGTIYETHLRSRPSHHKRPYRWQVTSWPRTKAVYEMFKPYLCSRRCARWEQVLAMSPSAPQLSLIGFRHE